MLPCRARQDLTNVSGLYQQGGQLKARAEGLWEHDNVIEITQKHLSLLPEELHLLWILVALFSHSERLIWLWLANLSCLWKSGTHCNQIHGAHVGFFPKITQERKEFPVCLFSLVFLSTPNLQCSGYLGHVFSVLVTGLCYSKLCY